MEFALSEEHQMLKDLVRHFVDDQLIPLERTVLEREAAGGGTIVTPEECVSIDRKSRIGSADGRHDRG
jgi:acyl-CoA dehydrogenase